MRSFLTDDLIRMFLITAALVFAVVGDLRSKKISNKLSLVSFAGCLIYLSSRGSLGVVGSGLISTLLAFLITLPLYLTKVLGGGDLKIFAAVATLMSWQAVLVAAFAALLWGSILGVLQSIIGGQGKALANNLFSILITRTRPAEQTLHKIPYSVALFFGSLSTFVYLGTV